ncbi:MAG TPA: ABC transporter ATP-binding protein [Steroidobacteraceae bacterium]|nr:ABC transporter ATP-binding protein [Steroidobacteraceae bacterium]
MPQQPLAQLTDAHKRFGNIAALDGLSLAVDRGEMLALLGPNGAGKTTAISILLGLQRADRGVAALFGEDPQSIDARRRIGVMMQEVNFPTVMRPRELIAQTASYYPGPYDVQAVIKRLGIEKIADRPYGKLSGGQKRQAQFAMAIAGRPELLFLDEPTVGLDVHAREAMWQVIRDLIHEGCSIILTTHYIEEAEALANRVAVISHGRLVASGTVDEVRAHVTRKSIWCRSSVPLETLRAWPEVEQVSEDSGRQHIATRDAESVLRKLLAADAGVRDIEVKRAGLGEAFAELTSTSGTLQ